MLFCRNDSGRGGARRARTALFLSIAAYVYFALLVPLVFPARVDLAVNYTAATLLRTHAESLYDPAAQRAVNDARVGTLKDYEALYKDPLTSYTNPPTTAILVLPLSLLSFRVASIVFLLVSHALYLGAILLWLDTLAVARGSPLRRLAAYCALPFFPIAVSLFLGNMDALIVFELTLALRAALAGRDARAGAWIAAAAAVKISPVCILGFFVARRRFRALAGAGLAGAAIVGIEFAVAGRHNVFYFVRHVMPMVGKGSAFHDNQSLLGMIYRYVMPKAAAMSFAEVTGYRAARAIWLLASTAIALVTLALTHRTRLESRALTAIAVGAFIVVAVLSGAISWDHYMTWTLLPVIALAVDWHETQWLAPRPFWRAFSSAVFLMAFPELFQIPLYYGLGSLGPVASPLGTYGMLILLGLVWMRLRAAGRDESAETAGSTPFATAE